MNVKELMEELQRIEDKTLDVFIFKDSEIYPIELIDTTISDRIDINIGERW